MTSKTSNRTLVRPANSDDLTAIRRILNAEILTSTSSWTTIPKSERDIGIWYDDRIGAGYPVLVAEHPSGSGVAGYASYGPFRSGQGYAACVEHSVYVDAARRGHGIAACLLDQLVRQARRAGKTLMVGGVSSEAKASLRFHRRMGFVEAGRLPGAGRKFGRSLDLVWMTRSL